MTVSDILNSIKFVVDPNGRQSAVVVDMDVWDQIVALLEDAEDADELKKARSVQEKTIPWERAKKDLNLGE